MFSLIKQSLGFSSVVLVSFICQFVTTRALAAPMSLKDTVKYAVENSRTLQAARHELEISELEARNSWSVFLPSLDASAVHGIQDSDPSAGGTAPWASQFQIALTENLYDNGASITKYKIAKAAKDRQRLIFMKARAQLCLAVAKEFFRFSLAKQLLVVRSKQNDILKKQHQSMNNQFQQGRKTRRDVLRFEAQLRRSDIDLTTARNQIKRSELELIKIINAKDPSVKLEFLPESPQTKPSLEPVSMGDLENHYDVQILKLQSQEKDLATDLIRREDWPRVDLSAGLSYNDADYINKTTQADATDSVQWNVLVSLKYSLWDWGIRNRNLQSAILKQKIQEDSLETSKLALQTEVENLLLDIQGLQANLKLNEELLALEQKNYTLMSEDYRRGILSYLDLVTALNDLSSAQHGYFSAVFNLREALLAIYYHKGQLYEHLVKE